MSHPPALERAARVLTIEGEAVLALKERLGDSFGRAIDLLLAAPGKVVVTGMGKSGLVGRKIASTMASTGTPAFFLHPAEGIHGDIGMVHEGDVVIALSNSGETAEVTALLPAFKRLGLPLIALTGVPTSTLGRYADATLDVSVKEEACSLGLAPTSSTTAALAMGDALAVVLYERKGFSENDFALRHPGGSLGRRLTTVADLMHRGDAVPLVPLDAPLADVLFVISAKRLGVTGVTGPAGELAGVITDGDVRRAMARGVDVYSSTAADVMTANPKRVHADDLAASALRKMEDLSITTLFVFEEGEEEVPAGIVHIHDLLRGGA